MVQEFFKLFPLLLFELISLNVDRALDKFFEAHCGACSSFLSFNLFLDLSEFGLFLSVFKTHVLFKLCFVATLFEIDDVQGCIDFFPIFTVVRLYRLLQNVKNLVVLLLNGSFDRLDFPVAIASEKVALAIDFAEVEVDEPQH